ncbi:MAG: tetratricopeptide repeat protein [Thermoplasmata archaeon]
MTSPTFVELVTHLLEAMGQRLDAARPIPEGLLLRTGDGFLYAFLGDPAEVSLQSIEQLIREAGPSGARLVVLTPGRLPLALVAELSQKGATVVESQRFRELARQLDLESYLGEAPHASPEANKSRLLPSAQTLDLIMGRARTWAEWGVPALALRFYRQALSLKPEFLPARTGIGRALLALGLTDDADRTFDEVLATRRNDVEARLGKAAVLGARGHANQEIALYRTLLAEDPKRIEVRTHLMAALIAQNEWRAARLEIETMLGPNPEDPSLRFLHAVALDRTGSPDAGKEEREHARQLGLTFDRESALCGYLGIPPPVPPPLPPAPVLLEELPSPGASATRPRVRLPARTDAPKRKRASPRRAKSTSTRAHPSARKRK